MKLTFLGATHEVTGSCYLLEACQKRVLIDYGMEQGEDIFENAELPVKPSDVDMVLLTHAHMDHSGKLPLLYKEGFQGQIFSTAATADLCEIMLRDSAHIQMFEAEWKNRKGMRAGREMVQPLYDMEDAEGALRCFVRCRYGEEIRIAEGIRIRFIDAGHLLGSSSIEVWVKEGKTEKKIVFSGDIGNCNQPLIRDPQYPTQADYVLMESTYGDRSHDAPADYATALAEVIQRTFDRRGNVVVPSFAVGRTQEMLYFIRRIKEEGLVHGHDGFEVWVDSPLAIEATNIFRQHMWSDFDDEATELVERGINPIGFEGLRTSVTAEDSRAINEKPQPKVILSASGMCDAGRIKHHLKHNLWRKESTILFVGYQAHGTLGRALLEGAEHVKLFGEEVAVRAKVVNFQGLSSHADHDHLVNWISQFKEPKPQHVFVVHGDREVAPVFAQTVTQLGFAAHAPQYTESYDLLTCRQLEAGYLPERKKPAFEGAPRTTAAYQRLVQLGDALLGLIRRSKGRDNKTLASFAESLRKLIEKFEF